MTTTPLYYDDPYTRECRAEVIAVANGAVVLDRTVFYPRGGGQPGDTGVLTDGRGQRWAVTDTTRGDDGIRHHIGDDATPPTPGTTVSAALDWDRRHRHMRMHTCLHLLGSLVPAGVTGGAIGEWRSRLDFDAGDLSLDREALTRRLNALIASDPPVAVEHVDESVLESNPELVRTMSVAPPRGVGRLRMLRIEGVDYQPCGGTHVAHITEIGLVAVTRIESKGRRNRRIQVALEEGQ